MQHREVYPLYSNGTNAGAMRGYRSSGNCTRNHTGWEANFKYPAPSASCSISEAMTAGSILSCSLVVVDANHSVALRVRDCVI